MNKQDVIYKLRKIKEICLEDNDHFGEQLDRIYDEVEDLLFELEVLDEQD